MSGFLPGEELRKEVSMDRNKRRVTYMTGANATFGSYGMNEDSKKKKKKPLSARLRMLIALLARARPDGRGLRPRLYVQPPGHRL